MASLVSAVRGDPVFLCCVRIIISVPKCVMCTYLCITKACPLWGLKHILGKALICPTETSFFSFSNRCCIFELSKTSIELCMWSELTKIRDCMVRLFWYESYKYPIDTYCHDPERNLFFWYNSQKTKEWQVKKKKKKVVCFNLLRNAANFVNVIQTDFLAKFIGRIPPYAVAVKSKDLCWLWICPRVEEKRSRIRKSHGFSAPWVFWAFQVDIYFSWLCFQ